MAASGLTAFWIVEPSQRGPLGFGVTARSIEDALHILVSLGYGIWLPRDRSTLRVTPNVSIERLPPYVRQRMGPIVVRGMWYPFTSVGAPAWTDD